MKIIISFFLLFNNILFSNTLDNLLNEYDNNNKKSLSTVDEKLGHVFIYSQKEIQQMQYHKLNDILKELPLLNLNKNRFGTDTLAIAGSKTYISGFYRVFINDHEISSSYNQSASASWGNMPLDFVDHIEIYYGESSFVSGNEAGIYFIRLYTKQAIKENGSEVNLRVSSKGSSAQSITDSRLFENGWSYLLFLNNDIEKDSNTYKNNKLLNDTKRRYLYLDVRNEDTSINLAYADLKKDVYTGLSYDAVPDDGKIVSKDFYADISKYFLYDKSLKFNFSIDVNKMKYDESNIEGLDFIPLFRTNPIKIEEDLKFTKLKAGVSKSFEYKNNNFIAALNFSNKKYETKNIKATYLSGERNIPQYSNFDEEQITSVLFQNDYKIKDDLVIIANAKFDTYKRSGILENTNEELYRVGAIYMPFENFGLKSFYTKSYVPPSFYHLDNAVITKKLDMQDYSFYTVEGVYKTDKSKFGITYHHVHIDDFIHFEPGIGFLNLPEKIKTSGLIYSYDYIFSDYNKLQINYFRTTLNVQTNNSNSGGFIKYMGNYNKFEYFASLIHRNAYEYLGVDVNSSFDASLGLAYKVNKNIKLSLKANNIFNDSTKSLYTDNRNDFSLDDSAPSVTASLKWLF